MNDELGLPSGAFERHNREPGRAGGDFRAKIAPNNVKTQIQAGCGAGDQGCEGRDGGAFDAFRSDDDADLCGCNRRGN